MEITLHQKMLLTEHTELHVDASDKGDNTLWITTKAGKFKLTGDGLVVFFGQNGDDESGEIIHNNG